MNQWGLRADHSFWRQLRGVAYPQFDQSAFCVSVTLIVRSIRVTETKPSYFSAKSSFWRKSTRIEANVVDDHYFAQDMWFFVVLGWFCDNILILGFSDTFCTTNSCQWNKIVHFLRNIINFLRKTIFFRAKSHIWLAKVHFLLAKAYFLLAKYTFTILCWH